jgi:hypothetical protein
MIRKFLDISTGYLTENDANRLYESRDVLVVPGPINPPRIIEHAHGYWVHIDSDLSTYLEHVRYFKKIKMSAQFIRIMAYARARHCWWLNIDEDGEKIANAKKHDFKEIDWDA